jgi:hypothetical protein
MKNITDFSQKFVKVLYAWFTKTVTPYSFIKR